MKMNLPHLRRRALLLLAAMAALTAARAERYDLNQGWAYAVGDRGPERPADAVSVTLPHAHNESDAFRVHISEHTDTISWWYKTFRLPDGATPARVLLEMEGVRQAAEVYINGHAVGLSENGAMAFGIDLTPYIDRKGENRLAVHVDNSWMYRERATGVRYQWNDRNFNVNYGGITKRVWLHLKGDVYQTLPLYSGLGTTGTYVYASDYNVPKRTATVHVESQVINASAQPQRARLDVEVADADGRTVARYSGPSVTLAAGDTATLTAQKKVSGLHFWSWGYGYLYTVTARLSVDGKTVDVTPIRTGFRQTRFAEGRIWLNGRVLMMHGYAQRSSNEWPSVGVDIPAWVSDFSNGLMVEGNANLVRWMHITPSKQDIESCDRVGLIQAMPAGDAEKDREGRQWAQRTELMRDAIIYNRNNPSILFYECGNESISREHMIEMKRIRDEYDPHGGRAIGSREMLDIDEAEYGGEMLYLNKSGKHPMWAMEYCRDEGYRMYWDDYSYPYHRHGAGPLYRKAPATDYNRNMDDLVVEQVRRWDDYYVLRPGAGRRVSSGGVKIIFSDTNTHNRSEFNYRTSGATDAMRIPKDSYFAHQVMWDGWVDVEQPRLHIVGHWNYDAGTRKPIYVVANTEAVELYLNGKSLGRGERSADFLFTFPQVEFEPGTLRAIALDADGRALAADTLQTAGPAAALRLTLRTAPEGMTADGADLALVDVEVVDKDGRRCPLDNRTVRWTLEGPAEWRGGIAKSGDLDNHILDTALPVEAGISRVIVRSTPEAGEIKLTATATGLEPQSLTWQSRATTYDAATGLAATPAAELPCRLGRGETPQTPSYTDRLRTVTILSAQTAAQDGTETHAFDDNELSEWRNDGRLQTAWITFTLAEPAAVDEISIKLTGWRQRSYPLEVVALADDGTETVVWKGQTDKSLGYVSLRIAEPVKARRYTIRQIGAATDKEAFGQITELAAATAGELDLYKTPGSEKVKGELRIVEVDFLQNAAK